jgi:hypothetical protein
MSGWFALKRGSLEHEVFAPVGRWSRFEAWVWLIENAAFKDTDIDLGGKPYTVKRGSLVHSQRFLARKWRWSQKAVVTFLKTLAAHSSIKLGEAKTGKGPKSKRTHITLCNYEKYQNSGSAEASKEKQKGVKEEQGNNIPIGADEKSPAADPVEITTVTSALWDIGKRYLAQHGIANPGSLIGKWLKQSKGSASEVMAAIEAAQKAGTQDPVPLHPENHQRRQTAAPRSWHPCWCLWFYSGGGLMDLERFEHTAAWLEYCDGMSRFHAETEAARRQGLKRWEAKNEINARNSERCGNNCQADARQPKNDLSGMQSHPAKEDGPLPEHQLPAGRRGLEMLALRG